MSDKQPEPFHKDVYDKQYEVVGGWYEVMKDNLTKLEVDSFPQVWVDKEEWINRFSVLREGLQKLREMACANINGNHDSITKIEN